MPTEPAPESGRQMLLWFVGPLVVIAVGVAIVLLFMREDPADVKAQAALASPALSVAHGARLDLAVS
jgi:hypothetical protein